MRNYFKISFCYRLIINNESSQGIFFTYTDVAVILYRIRSSDIAHTNTHTGHNNQEANRQRPYVREGDL